MACPTSILGVRCEITPPSLLHLRRRASLELLQALENRLDLKDARAALVEAKDRRTVPWEQMQADATSLAERSKPGHSGYSSDVSRCASARQVLPRRRKPLQ